MLSNSKAYGPRSVNALLEPHPFAVDQTFVGLEAAFVNHVRRVFDIVAKIEMFDPPGGAQLNLLQNGIGSDTVLGEIRVVVSVDRRKAIGANVANRNANQLAFVTISDLKRIETAAHKAPNVFFAVDVGVMFGQAAGSSMLVE